MDLKRTLTIAWLAGLIEGEGSFCVKKTGQCIMISMTDLDVLERVRDNFGGSIYILKKRKEHWKECWRWQINGTEAYRLALLIRPYLLSRRLVACNKLIESCYNSPRVMQRRNLEKAMVDVKQLQKTGFNNQAIANELGISRKIVSNILLGKTETSIYSLHGS